MEIEMDSALGQDSCWFDCFRTEFEAKTKSTSNLNPEPSRAFFRLDEIKEANLTNINIK